MFDIKKLPLLIFFGAIIGIINGLFGAGGGMLCVVALLLVGLQNKEAQATAILVMLPTSIASSIIYYTSMDFDWVQILSTSIGASIGGILGAMLLNKINNTVLAYIFAVILIVSGVIMLIL